MSSRKEQLRIWSVGIGCAVMAALKALPFSVLSIFSLPMCEELGVSMGSISIIFSAVSVGTLIMSLAIGRIFFSDFGLFYQVPQNSGALFSVTNTIDTYVYRALIQLGDVGMASAAGVYQSIVGFVLILITNLIVRKISPENALF